jgi:ATP-dependent RNA helicase DDX24/MAK5
MGEGSGKTLAYGVPIIQHLIGELQDGNAKLKKPSALILTPTRELALQVKDHLMKLLDNTLSPGAKHGPIRIIALTGGMSIQKQRRLLQTGVQVIVATPGRLWDLISESADMGQKLSQLDFLVLDEADRMIEGGHFAELDNIFKLTNRFEPARAMQRIALTPARLEPRSPSRMTSKRQAFRPRDTSRTRTCAITSSQPR